MNEGLIFAALFNNYLSYPWKDPEMNEQNLSPKLIKAAVDCTKDAVLILDKDGNVLYFNESFGYLCGYTPNEKEHINLSTLFTDFDNSKEKIKEIFSSNTFDNEINLRSSNEKVIPCWLRKNQIMDDNFNEQGTIWNLNDISEKKEAEKEKENLISQLEKLSLYDELTGLSNRRGFYLLARQEILRDRRNTEPFTVLFIDMDGLKKINDVLGHKDGDKALQAVSIVMKETFRLSDIMARLGGDEFVVIAIKTSEKDIIIKRFLDALEKFNKDNRPPEWPVNVSIGGIVSDPTQPISIDELVTKADSIMYQHKKTKKTVRE